MNRLNLLCGSQASWQQRAQLDTGFAGWSSNFTDMVGSTIALPGGGATFFQKVAGEWGSVSYANAFARKYSITQSGLAHVLLRTNNTVELTTRPSTAVSFFDASVVTLSNSLPEWPAYSGVYTQYPAFSSDYTGTTTVFAEAEPGPGNGGSPVSPTGTRVGTAINVAGSLVTSSFSLSGATLPSMVRVSVNPAGTSMVVVDATGLARVYNYTGTPSSPWTFIGSPTGLVVSEARWLSNDMLLCLTASTAVLWSRTSGAVSGSYSRPSWLVRFLGGDDTLAIAAENNDVTVFDPSTGLVKGQERFTQPIYGAANDARVLVGKSGTLATIFER